MHPLVSVIVTTKNEENNIANCLQSILRQTYNNIEIIIVDNNSIDKTREIVFSFGSPIIHFYTHGPERSAQRNWGIRKAKGEYVLYLDADMIVSKNVIVDCVKKIRSETNTIALYISEIIMGKSFWCRVRKFERSFYDGTVIDCVRFVSKKAFGAVKGFDESMSGPEDWDLDKKIRQLGKTNLIKTPIYHNEQNFNIFTYLKKKNYYSRSFERYINKWGKDDEDIKKQFGISYRYFGVFVENNKWKKILLHPILTFGMFSLRFLVGIVFLSKK